MMTTVQQMSSFEFQMVCAVRLILASCCGLCIGIERTNRLKDAGIRTHLIVCMGAALMMLVSKYGFFDVSPQGGCLPRGVQRGLGRRLPRCGHHL